MMYKFLFSVLVFTVVVNSQEISTEKIKKNIIVLSSLKDEEVARLENIILISQKLDKNFFNQKKELEKFLFNIRRNKILVSFIFSRAQKMKAQRNHQNKKDISYTPIDTIKENLQKKPYNINAIETLLKYHFDRLETVSVIQNILLSYKILEPGEIIFFLRILEIISKKEDSYLKKIYTNIFSKFLFGGEEKNITSKQTKLSNFIKKISVALYLREIHNDKGKEYLDYFFSLPKNEIDDDIWWLYKRFLLKSFSKNSDDIYYELVYTKNKKVTLSDYQKTFRLQTAIKKIKNDNILDWYKKNRKYFTYDSVLGCWDLNKTSK